MSTIDKLLEGVEVEWKMLGDVAKYEQPTKYLVDSNFYNDIFPTPVLTAGKTFILGYTNEEYGIYEASKNPVIIFDDFTTANKWVDFNFKAKSSAMKMITSIDESKTLLKYIYYWLNTLPSGLVEGDHKRQWISNYTNLQIPIPPLPVQKEIVRILDTFTELTAELTAELTVRKKQYNFYREQLLNFDITTKGTKNTKEVVWKTLGEVLTIKNGKDYKCFKFGNIPVYGSGGIMTYIDTYVFDKPSVLIPRKGSIGNLFYVDVPFWTVDTIFWTDINTSVIIPKFLYFFLQTQHLEELNMAGGVPSLTQTILNKVPIPIPSLEEQARIVSILDTFDTLTTSISEGLPKEIELRKKQYEYYRDRLLTF